MANDPWAAFPAVDQAPKPLRGPPPKPEDPAEKARKDAAEERARQDQSMQVEKFNWERDRAAKTDDLKSKEVKKPTEYQAKSAGFLGRMLQAEQQFKSVPAGSRDARTVPGQWLHNTMPGVDATFNTSDRNSADNAARNFIGATLRQESGAAITPEEYRNQYRIFFPMPGDTDQQIAEKERARAQAIEGFKIAAGPLAAEAMATVQPEPPRDQQDGQSGVAVGSAAPPPSDGIGGPPRFPNLSGPAFEADGDQWWDRTEWLKRTRGMTPEDEQQLVGWLNSNRGNQTITAATVNAFYDQRGWPRPNDPEKAAADMRGGKTNFTGYDDTADREARKAELQSMSNERNHAEGQGAEYDPTTGRRYAERAISGAVFGNDDEINAVEGGFNALIEGGNPVEGYKQERDMLRLRKQQNEEGQGWAGTATEIVGSVPSTVLLPGGLSRTVGGAAKAGGVAGALTGLGGAKNMEEAPSRVVTGAAIGAGAGGLIQGGLNKALPGMGVVGNALSRNKVPDGLDVGVIEAGARRGIPVRAPDAAPSLRGKMAVTQASQYGGGKIDDALASDKSLIQAQMAKIGGKGKSMSGETGDYNLGKMGRKVGEDYIERTRLQKNDLYGEAEQLSAGGRVKPDSALAEVDRHIAELEAVGKSTNRAQIDNLRGLKADMSKPEGFSITEFQGLRKGASEKIKGDQALTSTDADRRLGDIVRAFTGDASEQLPGKAATKLAEADEFFGKRADMINGTLKKLLGTRGKPASPEDIGKRLVAMTRNRADNEGLQKVLKEASPDQRADFAATIAENMGKGRNGEFSLAALATNISKTPGNVRVTIFGKDGNAAMKDIQALARAKGDTASGLNNSKSGLVMARQIVSRMVLGAGAGGAATGSVTGAIAAPLAGELIAAIGQRRAAQALLNPKFTKVLRNAPKQATPAQVKTYLGDMEAALLRNPTTAALVDNVIPLFEKRLSGAMAQSPTRAAASEEEKD